MLIQSVRFTFAPEDTARAEAILRELVEPSRAEPGVISFDVARGVDQPNDFALWEVYRDRAAFDAHRASDHYQRLVVNGVRALAKERMGELLSPI